MINKDRLPTLCWPLADKLNAGSFVQCAHCKTWADKAKVAALSIFIPKPHVYPGLSDIPYAVCKRCFKKNTTQEQLQAMSEKIEANLTAN
jgi:hypothetical protein